MGEERERDILKATTEENKDVAPLEEEVRNRK